MNKIVSTHILAIYLKHDMIIKFEGLRRGGGGVLWYFEVTEKLDLKFYGTWEVLRRTKILVPGR